MCRTGAAGPRKYCERCGGSAEQARRKRDAEERRRRGATVREVTTERFGSVEAAVAFGLALRYDGGPCFRSEHYQTEIDHLGIARSPAYHYEPETNGCAEKFIQTLKGAAVRLLSPITRRLADAG